MRSQSERNEPSVVNDAWADMKRQSPTGAGTGLSTEVLRGMEAQLDLI